MNIYEKLQYVRCELQDKNIKKTGKNTFAKYEYYELKDFIPTINNIFKENKLCSMISFTNELATLEIVNAEKPDEKIIFTSPMRETEIKGTNQIQALGGVETYQRRYLYMTALEIVENDMFDGSKLPNKEVQLPNTNIYIGSKELEQLKGIGLQNEKATEIIKSFGLKSSKEITKELFPKVLEAFEGGK